MNDLVDPAPAPSRACGIFFNTFDLMSAHVKPPIATHFAYPPAPAKGSALRAAPGPRLQISRSPASPRRCPIRGPTRRAALGSRNKSLPRSGAARSVRAGRKHSGSPRSEDLPGVALNYPTGAHFYCGSVLLNNARRILPASPLWVMIRECEQDFEQLPHNRATPPSLVQVVQACPAVFHDTQQVVIGERPAGRFKASDRLGEILGGKGASLRRLAFIRVEHRAKDSRKRLWVIDR